MASRTQPRSLPGVEFEQILFGTQISGEIEDADSVAAPMNGALRWMAMVAALAGKQSLCSSSLYDI